MSLYANPIVERMGWMLLHSLWLFAIPAALFGLLLWLTPQKYCRLRYAAGMVALLAMMLLPIGVAPFVGANADRVATIQNGETSEAETAVDIDLLESNPAELIQQADSQGAFEKARGSDRRSAPLPDADAAGGAFVSEPNRSGVDDEADTSLDKASIASVDADEKPNALVLFSNLNLVRPFLPWGVAAWMLGVLMMSFRLLAGWRSTRKLKRSGIHAVPDATEALFVELKERIGGCKAARLVHSTLVSVPSIVGHFRPIVLLPVSALTGLNEQQLRAILAHELAHVRRHDYLVNICQTVVETLLFYHPAVWWISRCVREERENCCDDVALQHGCRASELARALVTVEAIRPAKGQNLVYSALITAADGGSLLRRVRRLAGGNADKHVVGRSWIAGGIALLLTAAMFAGAINLTSVAQEPEQQVIAKESDEQGNQQEETTGDADSSNLGRLDFAGGYFLELAAIGDMAQIEVDTEATQAWSVTGSEIDTPFFGVQVRPGLAVPENQMARKFYVRAQMPEGTEVDLDVAGKRTSGSLVQSSSDSDWKGVGIEASTIAILPDDQESVELTVNLQLPAWRTIASFDFAGGVKNGIIMDWEQKVSEFSRYTATGDFGPDATKDNIRIIALDQQHQQLEVAQGGNRSKDGRLTEMKAAFKISDGRPWHVIVQRRITTRPIVFRDVPLNSGKHPGVGIFVQGNLLGGSAASLEGDFITTIDPQQAAGYSLPVIGEAATEGTEANISVVGKEYPLTILLAEPFEPLSAELPEAGTIQLVSVSEAGSASPGWHADGSPRLVPFQDDELQRLLSRRETDGDYRELEVFFEFVASSSDTRVGRVRVQPLDGFGTATWKPIQKGDADRPGVRLLQALNILDDRGTEDFEVDVFAGPLSTLTTLPIVDPPDDDGAKSRPVSDPDPDAKGIALLINGPEETKAGNRHAVSVTLPEEALQGVVLTGLTSEGKRVDGFVNSSGGRKIVGTFIAPAGQRLESVEIATQPQHSMVFRNVSVWSGLGSSAFVDQSEPAAIDFDFITPSRVFLRPNGERIAEQDGGGVGVSPALAALNEIERRGGLFRFDAEAEAASGETLPYLTEIRWRDFRADELRWIQALAGLTRLELSSEHVTDESLRSIEHLSTLTKLEISRSRHLTTDCLKSIGELTELRELQLVSSLKWNEKGYNAKDFDELRGLTEIVEWEPYDWRMDDAGIAWLKDTSELEMVFGWGPEVTDAGFAALAEKPNLGVVRLGTTKITDASFKLLENHAELYWLQCSSPNLTDAAIDSAVTVSRLRDLYLNGSQVTDAGVETLIEALPTLPRLRTVKLTDTQVSAGAVQRLREAREGLKVLASEPPAGENVDPLQAEQADEPATTEENPSDESAVSDETRSDGENEGDRTLTATAPQDVPWPDKRWTKSLPPSGSGIRVKLDDRRWVEFNSVYATRKVDDERTKIHWKADGELIDPPADFDPTSLVPDRDGGEMPSVTRGFLMQVVGPRGIRVALDTSGGGGYSTPDYPVDDPYIQIPLNTIASSIGYNHAYVEVKVSQETKDPISIDDPRFQVLTDPEERKVYIATADAKDFAWQMMIARDGKAAEVKPYLIGGVAGKSTMVSDELKSQLKDNFRTAQLLGFAFDKDQPLPKLESLQRSPYDVVRFDNLSVYPGPRAAVTVSVNGVPIDEANRPKITSSEDVNVEEFLGGSTGEEDFETVTLTGTVVDENGFAIDDCWVGLFIQPQEYYGQSTRSPPWAKQPLSAFGDGPPLTLETRTNALGQFTFEAPKTHFVFEGQFWAMRPDGTLGNKWLNAVWSHVQKPENLRVTIPDDEATVRVLDPEGKPVADADVALQAFRGRRSVTQRLPEFVQQRTRTETDDSGQVTFGGMETAAVRGVAVSAESYGTQFLSDRLASSWVRDDQPLTLKLQRTASLAGRVIDFDPQLDQGLKLKARTEQNDDRPPMYGRAIADVAADGTFQIDRLVAGSVSLESSLPPDSRQKIRFQYIPQLKAGEDRKLDADHNPQVVPAVVVRQRLIKSDTGEGIPNSRLSVLWGDRGDGGRFQQSQPLTTDADGWWMARVLPGTIDVRLVSVHEGYRSTAWFDGRNRRGSLKVPATDKLVTLPPERYVPAAEQAGRLQFADGSPATDWSVNGHPVSWDDVGLGAVRTGRDGSFTLTHPTGYPARFFSTSNREWMTEHDFTDRYVVPEVISSDPLVLQISTSPGVIGCKRNVGQDLS